MKIRLHFITVALALMTIACHNNTVETDLISTQVKQQLQRINASNKRYNALITVDSEAVIATANAQDQQAINQPLKGFTLAIKDNIHVANMPATSGSAALLNFIPTEDASVINRLKKAGAIIVGKANLHELAYGITSNNANFGAVANAHNPDFFAGGSSGGTAVAIALDYVRAGLGTDTGGSSRIPAALNGIVGFRPTTGRYPNDGLLLLSNTRDTVGPMAKTVADIHRLDSILSATSFEKIASIKPEKLRIGIPRQYFYENLSADVDRQMQQVLTLLKRQGITLIEKNIEGIEALNSSLSFPIVFYETKRLIPQYLKQYGIAMDSDRLISRLTSPDVSGIMQVIFNQPIADADYQTAVNQLRPQLQQLLQDYFDHNQLDAMIFPTTPLPASPIEGSDQSVLLNGRQVPTFTTYIRNVDPSSNAGIPGLTIPIGKSSKDLPIGLEIEAPAGQDQQLLAIGQLLESLLKPINH